VNARNAGQAFALVLSDEFARAGMRDACISPGSRSTPLALALAGDDRIKTHVVIDERSAAFLAVGIAKATQRPVAVLCTSGTAAANLHPAVIEARESHTPLLFLTADRPPELRATGANQTIDQIKLFGDAVAWFCEVGTPEARPDAVRYWRSVAARAWTVAGGSPSGPVHLNVALRDPLVPVEDERGFPFPLDGRPGGRPWTEGRSPVGAPDEADVEWLSGAAEKIEKGVIVAGATDIESGPVLEFAEATSWPLLAEPTSGLRAGPNAVSTYDALLRVTAFAGAHRPDLVLRFGKPGLSKSTMAWLSPETEQVIVDRDGAWLDPERSAARVITCDPAILCGDVAKAIPARSSSAWSASWLGAERRARRAIDDVLNREQAPSEPRTARDLAALVEEGSILTVAASMPVRDLDWFMAPRTSIRVFANRGANGIDGSVSTAVGAALGTGAPGYALLGDLALIHDSNGLLAGRDEGAGLVIVAINNQGGGIFSFLPQASYPEHFERLFATPHGIDIGGLAAAFGCRHERIERAEDLASAIDAVREIGEIGMVEVPTERAANVALHQKVWLEVERALR
jgi:2-succinyl-5-enolpyruvyl-6-hydroxy-3-cyclohexene-1-carboxylate synthase